MNAYLALPQARAVPIMSHFHTCNNEVGLPDYITYAFILNSIRATFIGLT